MIVAGLAEHESRMARARQLKTTGGAATSGHIGNIWFAHSILFASSVQEAVGEGNVHLTSVILLRIQLLGVTLTKCFSYADGMSHGDH